jgi:hypothetical protein
MSRSEAISLAAVAAFVLIALTLLIRFSMSCYSAGGTIVRGLVWLECIQ